ncbi:MAG: GTP 3',8-cyclase MoaA [Deltaproteobacteria bacterium]|nr:GTP 3',8-cyclase MoaA [Deltaproteobacteria bacterium]
MPLIDNHNRNLNYIRISITDRCNLNCLYCKPNIAVPKLTHNKILRYEEIIRLLKIFIKLGIKKVRVTGGEPLVRKGVYDFLKRLSEFKKLKDISLTTNGVLLKNNIDKIKDAGIKRINISLDTLKNKKFEKITGKKGFEKVWDGIITAYELGFNPIKINVVALKGINDNELIDFAKLTFDYPFQIRFIEYMPISATEKNGKKHLILTEQIMEKIASVGKLYEIKRDKNAGPAKLYKPNGAKGEIGFISPISRHFCADCNRLRLTAKGALRTCLLSPDETDLAVLMRAGASDDEIIEVILTAVSEKPKKHNLTAANQAIGACGQMSAIGG